MRELFDKVEGPPVRRWLIYSGRPRRDWLCVVAARTSADALKTARSMFELTRAAYAVEEGRAAGAAMAARVSFQP